MRVYLLLVYLNAITCEVEKQYNLFSAENDQFYSSADIRIEDTKLQEMIFNGTTSSNMLNYFIYK